MTPTSPRRRVAVVVTALLALGGAGVTTAADASADPAPSQVEYRVADGYWACVAVQNVDVGVCLANPLPHLSRN